MSIQQWVKESRESAHNIEHECDARNVVWNLNSSSIVFEVGCYKGRWALQIMERYPNVRMFCFEPQEWAYQTTKAVLKPYLNAEVFNIALGTKTAKLPMSRFGTDGASIYHATDKLRGNFDAVKYVELVDISVVISKLAITKIDLMLVNIEGYEFELIPYMFKKEIFPDRLVVQMHDKEQEPGLRELIGEYYNVFWDYPQLTAWRVKGD